MRPISGGSDPYGLRSARPRLHGAPVRGATHATALRPVEEVRAAGDVELSIRVFADGGSISVRRRTVAEADGTRRTVGIDAVVR